VLIRRTEREARRGTLAATLTAQSTGGLDRRSFLRRSGLAAGGLAALGTLSLESIRKAEAGPPPPPGATVTIRRNMCTHCSVGCTVIAEVANGVWTGQEPGWDSPINRGSHCCKGAAVRDDVGSERRLRYPMKLVNAGGTESLGIRRSMRSATSCWRSARSRDRNRCTGSAPPSSPTKPPISTASSRPSGEPTIPITRRASVIPPPSPAWPIPGATAR
jgi:hypothetical protein